MVLDRESRHGLPMKRASSVASAHPRAAKPAQDATVLYHEGTMALATRLMLAIPPDPPGFLAAVLDAFAEYLALHPDFRTVAFGAPGGGRYVSRPTREAYAGTGEVSAMVRDFLAEAYGMELTDAFELRLRLAIEIGDRLLAYAFEQDGEARLRVLDESKRILSAALFEP